MIAIDSPLLKRLDERVVVLDGGLGSELLAAEEDPPRDLRHSSFSCERILLEHPERVRAVHERFLAAGCDAIETASFGGDARSLERQGLAGRAFEVGRRAAAVARAAIAGCRDSERARFVLGAVGPGHELPCRGEVEPAVLRASYEPLLLGLAAGGADAFLIETCRDTAQARAAVEAAAASARRSGRRIPIFVSFSPDAAGRLADGRSVVEAWNELRDLPLELVALNCGAGLDALEAPLAELARSDAPRVGVYPSAGLPRVVEGRAEYPIAPDQLASFLLRAVQVHGAALVGGCCGATPEHLEAVMRTVADLRTPSA